MFKTLSGFILLALIGMAGFAVVQAQTQSSAPAAKAKPSVTAVATFAGGCFWCMEGPFDALDGVISTTSGYTGGTKKDPTYQEVSGGRTGHTEAVQIAYDPSKVSYEKLLDVFWHNIDPVAANRQFCDAGTQYRSGIFYHDDAQKKAAEASKIAIDKGRSFKGVIATEITAVGTFYAAEDYHQDYYRNNANAPYCRFVIKPKLEKLHLEK